MQSGVISAVPSVDVTRTGTIESVKGGSVRFVVTMQAGASVWGAQENDEVPDTVVDLEVLTSDFFEVFWQRFGKSCAGVLVSEDERRVRSSLGESSGVGSTAGEFSEVVTTAIVLAGIEDECQTEFGVVSR